MLGSTQTDDMEETRKNDFGRIYVAVLNPGLIPARLDVVIGDHYFELEFEVEKMGMDENGEEVDVKWNKEGQGEGEDGEDEVPKGGHDQDDSEAGRDNKRLRSAEKEEGSGDYMTWLLSLKEQVQNMNEQQFAAFLRGKAEEILDISFSNVLGEIADKVIAENDEEINGDAYAANPSDHNMGEGWWWRLMGEQHPGLIK